MAELLRIGSLLDAEGGRYCVAGYRADGRIDLLDVGNGAGRTVTKAWMDKVAVPADGAPCEDLAEISETAWEQALSRYRVIAPLLSVSKGREEKVSSAAKQAGVDRATLFRWIQRYEQQGTISSLVRRSRKDRASPRTGNQSEILVLKVLKQYFLTTQNAKVTHAYRELERLCREAGVSAPSFSTFYRRVQGISMVDRISAREGKSGKRRIKQVVGAFPGADYPYAVLQIDHTKVDLMLVDEAGRETLPRPYITVAIDVHSRMVAGYYISFDPPSVMTTAMCIAMAVLPKDQHLRDHGLDTDYPCRGIPRKIHLDNGKEFRSDALTRACQEYGIDLEYRPPRTPNYGGHIERLIGTLMSEIHALPGTTKSRSTDLKGYKPHEKAALTLQEFERWFANLVVAYHNQVHSALDMPPIKRYRDSIFGSDDAPGIGLPPVPETAEAVEKFRLDFMPLEERTVQRTGIEIDSIHYQADVLRPWVEARDPSSVRAKQKFIVRRDPRDISCIWFWDPRLLRYFRIPYRNPQFDAISVWELRAIKAYLKAQGKNAVDENTIFAARAEMRRVEQRAIATTNQARIEAEKIRTRKKKVQQSGLDKPSYAPVEAIAQGDDEEAAPQRFVVTRS